MKYFIDTSNLEQIKKIKDKFPIDGATTNPSLIAQSGQSIKTLIPQICELVQGPVSAEVLAVEEQPMFQEALELSLLHKHVVVKIPLIPEGLKVVRRLKEKNIPTNVTLCFSPIQALMAAQAGADMVSIFAGRLDDINQSGMKTVEDSLKILKLYSLKTKVLTASVRGPQHILKSALIGADIVTAPYAVLNQLLHHPLTDIGLEKFLKSARTAQSK